MQPFSHNGTNRLGFTMLLLVQTASLAVHAQFRLAEEVIVQAGATVLADPWVGGFNQPQLSPFDLNDDGFDDLIVFDKSGTVYATFLHIGIAGSAAYRYAPEYESALPPRSDWALFRDYNSDGLPDLFSYTTAGFGVWKASRNAVTGMPFFTQIKDVVRYADGDLRPPVFTSRADLPGFADINGDGDLDIITFGTFGGFVRYFENLTAENGWDADSLLFSFATDCWGNWFEAALCNGGDLNVFCRPGGGIGGKSQTKSGYNSQEQRAHAGSAICPLDHDGDGDLDMLMGDAGCNNLVLIRNGGTVFSATITGQDTAYPKTALSVNFPTYLAPFHLDVDQDGRADLLVAPNDDSEARNARMIWYYRNQSPDSVDLVFVQEDFLLGGMLDEGAETRVHIADLTGDGLPDLLVGRLNRVDGDGTRANGLTFFRNTGTAELAVFERITDDYAGLSALGRQGLAPTTGDLDGDGDLDLIVGDIGGNLHFYRNQAATGMPADFVLAEVDFQGINFGVQAVPALYDANRDGKLDLILGERNGNLNYLRNIGSASAPAFLLETEFWGAVDTRRLGFTVGSSAPFLRLNESNQTELYVGSQSGYLYRYSNIDGNLLGTFTLVDSSWGGLQPGLKSSVALADFNGDTVPDVLVGNIRGGLQLFTSKGVPPVIGFDPVLESARSLKVWPNPASTELFVALPIGLSGEFQWELLSSAGQPLLQGQYTGDRNASADGLLDQRQSQLEHTGSGQVLRISVSGLPRGLYLVVLREVSSARGSKPNVGYGAYSPGFYIEKIMLFP